jgi:hypothetical protein
VNEIDTYLAEVCSRLRAVLGGDLVGVYAGGSYALGGYDPGRSDLDVAAIVTAPLARERKAEIVERLRHESLPCPARGLELVVYVQEAVQTASQAAAFDLNLNTGARMELHVDYEPGKSEAHWYPIDRSILAAAGVALTGPPAAEVFAPIPRRLLLPVLEESLRWHLAGDPRSDDAVLNACRAWRYAAEGAWSSKESAGLWTLERRPTPVVAEALRARKGGRALDRSAVRRFLTGIADELGHLAGSKA